MYLLPEDTRVAVLFSASGSAPPRATQCCRPVAIRLRRRGLRHRKAPMRGNNKVKARRRSRQSRSPSARPTRANGGRNCGQKMWRALDELKPHVVAVPGWSFIDALSALEWCAANRTPAVVMSESTVWDERRVFWKEWIKTRLVKMNSAGLAGGTPHENISSNSAKRRTASS